MEHAYQPTQHCPYHQTEKQFYDEGCNNCEAIIELKHSQENVAQYTTLAFYGYVSRVWMRFVLISPPV